MADGNLVFNTKIDDTGVNKGTDKISSKMVDLKYKISATEREIARLQKDLEKLGNTNVKSKTVETLEKQVDKAKNKLNSLYAQADNIGNSKQAELTDMGFGTEYLDDMLARDENWQKIQQQISDAEVELSKYERELKNVQATENSISGKDTAEYAEKQEKIADLNGKLSVYKAKLNEVQEKESETATGSNDVKGNFQKLGNALKSTGNRLLSFVKKTYSFTDICKKLSDTVKKVGSNIKKAFSKTIGNTIKSIAGHTKKTNNQMNILQKSLQRIKQAFAGMILYKVLQSALGSIKEGIDNLAKSCPTVNKNLSALISSLAYLKNSLASAFAPIINIVTPILTGFMDTLSAVTNKVGQFIATLTGQSTYTQAIKVQKDYAESLDESAKATENLEKTTNNLASFDELNVMQQDSSNNSDEESTETLFQSVPTVFSNFAEQLKQAFSKGDYNAIGQLVADKLNTAMSNIRWTKIRTTAKNWASNIADFLNGAVSKLDWFLTGTTIGNGIMTAVDFAYTFFTNFDFANLGKGLANSINGVIKSVDWNKLGQTLGAMIQSVVSIGFGFVTTLDWKELGKSISNTINGFFKNIDWKQAGKAISIGAKGAFDSIGTALKKVDWKQIGKDIADFLTNIDWWGILEKAGEAMWNALTGLISFFSGMSGKNKVVDTLGKLAENFKELVKVTWSKLKTACNTVLKPLAEFFIDKVVPAVLEALAGAFKLFSNIIKQIKPKTLEAVASGIVAVATAIALFKAGQVIADGINKIKNAVSLFLSTISAHPLLAIATAIGGLVVAVQTYNALEWSSSEAKKFSDEIEIAKEKIETNTQAIADNLANTLETLDGIYTDNTLIDDYQAKLEELLSKATLTPEEQAQLETIVTYFENNIDGFKTVWDQYVLKSDDGTLHLTEDLGLVQEEINKTIDDYQKLANINALSDLSTQTAKDKISATRSLAQVQQDYENKKKEIDSAYYEFKRLFDDAGYDEQTAKDLMKRLESSDGNAFTNEAWGEAWNTYKSMTNDLKDLTEDYNKQIAEVNRLTMTSDDLSDVQKVLNGDFSDAAAVMMAYNAGMVNLEDVQNSQWKTLNNLKSAAEESGKNMVIGLVEGTEEYKGALVANSNGLAGLVLSEYDRTMAINSPSKEMYNRGYYTVQGLIDGINESRSRLRKACENIWNMVKGVFSDGVNFNSFITSIGTVFKTAINNLIDGLNTVIKIPFDSLNIALSGLKKWQFAGIEPFSWIPEIGIPQIPKLATGAYVPANYGEFLAVLGDNKREAEFVTPESKLEQAIINAMAKADFGGGDIHNVIYLDGDPIYEGIVKRNNAEIKRRGYSPLAKNY